MLILRHIRHCPAPARGAVLALGNFDGIHRGHQAVIQEAVRLARELNVPAAVMTFEPHPRRVFNPLLPPLRIIPFHLKARLIRGLGVDVLWVVHFTPAFSQTTAEHFVRALLVESMGVRHVVTGGDFIFGHKRQGTTTYLAEMSESLGFGYTQVAPVMHGGAPCSSTRIRTLLEKGDIAEAEAILGRGYEVTGRVTMGDQRGRQLGFPTANLLPNHLFLPARGVYAVRFAISEGKDSAIWDRPNWQKGVANLGIRPTFDGKRLLLEVHSLEQGGDWYGRRMRVQFVKYLRTELSFAGIDALKAQITRDCAAAMDILRQEKTDVA